MSSFVKSNITLPEQDDQRIYLQSILNNHADAINQRDIAIYDTDENPTGALWPNPAANPFAQNTSYRIAIPISVNFTLNPSGVNSFPHGLDIKGFYPTMVIGTLGNGVDTMIGLNWPGADQVTIEVNATDVIVTCSTNTFDGYKGFATIEYLKVI